MRRLLALILSDYRAHYSYKGETRRKGWTMFLPRAIANPSLHATILLRLTYATPSWMIAFWRNVLLTKHTIDIMHHIEVGPGIVLPHPWGLCLGEGVQVGANCTMFHNVSIGALAGHQRIDGPARLCPVIGDNVVIYMGAVILGPITVGDGAIIGARAWVDRDVPPGAVVSATVRDAAKPMTES